MKNITNELHEAINNALEVHSSKEDMLNTHVMKLIANCGWKNEKFKALNTVGVGELASLLYMGYTVDYWNKANLPSYFNLTINDNEKENIYIAIYDKQENTFYLAWNHGKYDKGNAKFDVETVLKNLNSGKWQVIEGK